MFFPVRVYCHQIACRLSRDDVGIYCCSGGYYPHHITLHNPFCLFRVFDLFTDGNLVSFANHAGKIQIHCMIGNAGKRNRVSRRVFGAGSQHQVKFTGTNLGIFKKGLIEIPHPHKEHTVRILFFEHLDLLHCRGELFFRCHSVILLAFER